MSKLAELAYPHLYRATDPDTSRLAASHFNAQRITEIQRAILAYMLGYPSGVTDLDIQRHFNDMGSTYRTRRAELVAQGRVKDSGRRMTQQARKRILWQLV
jgi:hypothetical protein